MNQCFISANKQVDTLGADTFNLYQAAGLYFRFFPSYSLSYFSLVVIASVCITLNLLYEDAHAHATTSELSAQRADLNKCIQADA